MITLKAVRESELFITTYPYAKFLFDDTKDSWMRILHNGLVKSHRVKIHHDLHAAIDWRMCDEHHQKFFDLYVLKHNLHIPVML